MIETLTVGQLAEWLHNNYEEIAKEVNWKTQEKCKVPFEELPKENKQVMIRLSIMILENLSLSRVKIINECKKELDKLK